jgi:hydroxyacylglutathione hydrolase
MESESIGKGIYQIPNLGYSNAYLAEIDSNNFVLIDTGTSSGGPKILQYLQKSGKSPNVISEIVLTHADPDHSGGAAALKRATGAKLAVGEFDAPRVSGQVKRIKETKGFGNIIFGFFALFMKVERVPPDVVLKDGDMVGPLSIIYTPGHTAGSICVYNPGEALFVGDILRTNRSGALTMPGNIMNNDPPELKKSVEKISKLEFSLLLPGHGKPITENASQKLKEFVARGFK